MCVSGVFLWYVRLLWRNCGGSVGRVGMWYAWAVRNDVEWMTSAKAYDDQGYQSRVQWRLRLHLPHLLLPRFLRRRVRTPRSCRTMASVLPTNSPSYCPTTSSSPHRRLHFRPASNSASWTMMTISMAPVARNLGLALLVRCAE